MATLPDIPLSYSTSLTDQVKVRRVDYGDGYSQRSTSNINSVREQWRLVWDGINTADMNTLRDFFRGLRGVDVLEWVPFGETESLKFTAGDFSVTPVGYDAYNCNVAITQEFDL